MTGGTIVTFFQGLAWRDISVPCKQTVIGAAWGPGPIVPDDGGVRRQFRQTAKLPLPNLI